VQNLEQQEVDRGDRIEDATPPRVASVVTCLLNQLRVELLR